MHVEGGDGKLSWHRAIVAEDFVPATTMYDMRVTTVERLRDVVEKLPEDAAQEVLDFAEFLSARVRDDEWHAFTRRGFAANFGDDEPEYTLRDVIRR